MEKNVAIIIDNELPCNVPGIRTAATIHSKGYATHRDQATAVVDGRRSQPSAEKVPVRGAGREKWRIGIQNTYTAEVHGTRISGTKVPGM